MTTVPSASRHSVWRNAVLTAALLTACAWCVALVARADTPPAPVKSDGFRPAASIASLMAGQKQQFDALVALAADPAAKGRAHKMHEAAELLAEFGNVNIYHQDAADYREWATALRDLSLQVAVEAKKRDKADEAKIKDLVKRIDTACNDCHNKYQ